MRSLRNALAACAGSALHAPRTSVPFAALARGVNLDAPLDALAGRSVLLATADQTRAAMAMVALDGVARRLVLAPPDLLAGGLASVARDAEIEVAVVDDEGGAGDLAVASVRALDAPRPVDAEAPAETSTEWVLATSGSTGAPKLVSHSLAGLAGAIDTRCPPPPGTVWSTFYDIRRYGGLQVFLRAVLGPSSLVVCDPREALGDFLHRASAAGLTHLLGTPSHWRRALMSPALAMLRPRYVRLSGEIADQAILDRLKAAFPEAVVAHAYASTEAGVGFSVDDGREGFPATVLGAHEGIEIHVREDRLHVRSPRTGRRYLGPDAPYLMGDDGFVDTGDRVERRGERYVFLGRASGVINVGGAKVQPEEVEAVLHADPQIQAVRVSGRRNPILGAIVVADVVLRPGVEASCALRETLLDRCRSTLARHKVPTRLAFVETLPLSAGGKLVR